MSVSLVTIGKFGFKTQHLIIIGVLILSFTTAFLIRSQAADYGLELMEFDPFFNFRATQFIVEHGIAEYFNWHDDLSWYPNGRNVSATSQVMLHVTAAITYQIFGGGSSLYEFTILFPVVLASLTTIIIFALVRVIGGTTAGLFSSMFYSISIPLILRGNIGWFKSEPLGLFFGLLGLYLFLSGIKSENKKISISKLIFGGIILGCGLSAWGGIQFFVIPIGMFILALPFVRKDHQFLIWSIPIFVISFLATASSFEFVGTEFVFGLGGFSLIIPTVIFVACIIVQKFSRQEKKIKNGFIFIISIITIACVFVIINADSQFLPLPQFRYLNAINPFLTTENALVDSIAEHATTTIGQSFFFHSILMVFAGIGIWLILSRKSETYIKNDMMVFSLIIGLTGVYVSSAFVRLEVFASISLIVLSSIGLSILVNEIFSNKGLKILNTQNLLKISFMAIIIIFLVTPLVFPNSNWITSTKTPPTILNGGSSWNIATDDWKETFEWIKNNTPKDSVIAAWWDYGYWLETMSERATLADNFTVDHSRIEKIAQTLVSSPDEAWKNLEEMGADYIVVFVAGQRIDQGQDQPIYLLAGGGDESKKPWFMRIAGVPVNKFVQPDGMTGTDEFWNNTLLGKLFPFSTIAYIDTRNTDIQSQTFKMGLTPVYGKNIKYPTNGDGPFKFVHGSPSFENGDRYLIGVFVYEVNHNYIPTQTTNG